MRKIWILAALVAALAFSGLAATGASATLWLTPGGASLAMEEPGSSHGEFVVHHKNGLGGEVLVKCDILYLGKLGPGALAKIELVHNLSNAELDLVSCIVTRTNNPNCPLNSTAVVHFSGSPWHMLLMLVGTQTTLVLLTYTINILCSGAITMECKGETEEKFTENNGNGAKFESGTKEDECSDGGTDAILAATQVLGFTIS